MRNTARSLRINRLLRDNKQVITHINSLFITIAFSVGISRIIEYGGWEKLLYCLDLTLV